MARLAILLSLCVLSIGCIGIQQPTVEVTAVRLDEVSDQGARVLIDLLVTNPNEEEIPIPKVSYRLRVEGTDGFQFTDRVYKAMPENGQATLTLAAAVAGADIKGKPYLVDGKVVFEPKGELRRVFFDNYVPLPSTAFEDEGVLE